MPDMTSQITVKELFDSHSGKFGMQWIAGQQGGANIILPEESKDSQTTGKGTKRKKVSSKRKTTARFLPGATGKVISGIS